MKSYSPPQVAKGLRASLFATCLIGSVLPTLAQDPDFIFDFNSDPAGTLEIITNNPGSTEWRPSGGVDDTGYISLTDATTSTRAAIIFDDPTEGKPIEGFIFRVDCRIGGGTGTPADGLSLNIVRPNDPLLDPTSRGEGYAASPTGELNLPEEGSTTGLGIGFDAYFSGGSDVIGFSVRVDNELVTQIPAGTLNGEADDVTSLQTGPLDTVAPLDALTWQPFEVELTAAGELTIRWKGEIILEDFPVDYFPGPGQVVFGARTGDLTQHHHFDNISLTILATVNTVVSGLQFDQNSVQFQITDGETSPLDPDSLALIIDGEEVEIEVTKAGSVTTAVYTPAVPFEIASIHSYEIIAQDTDGNDVGREGSLSLPVPFFPIDPLPGAEPEAGLFGTRYIWGVTSPANITTFDSALDAIVAAGDGTLEGQFFDTVYDAIDHGPGGFFANAFPYPDEVVSDGTWTGDNFVQFSRGYIRISEAGDYTFGVHSDDGFGLRIPGMTFTDDFGNGRLDPGDASTYVHPEPTGDSNSRVVARNVQPGTYLVEFFWFEIGGGDFGELYVAKGVHETDASTGDWLLVGQGEAGTFPVPGVDENGWDVITSDPGGDVIGTNADALARIAATTGSTNHDAINFEDPGFGGVSSIPGAVPFPKDTEGVDDDNYAIFATATLVVEVGGTYELGFQSDDGGYLRVVDQEFGAITANATGSTVVEGDMLIADVPTGNSRSVAEIALEPGTYEIEFLGWEAGGGSYFEVFGRSEGMATFVALERDGARNVTVAPAVELVAPPSLNMPIVNYLRADGNITIDFVTFSVESEHEMQQSSDLLNWTTVEGATVEPLEGDLFRAVGPDTAEAESYFRVALLAPPPLLEEDFESGAPGWTVVDEDVWELGMPTAGPGSAHGGDNAFATILDGPYPQGFDQGADLRSPVIDLTEVTRARLRFWHYYDTPQDVAGGILQFLDAATLQPLFTSTEDLIFDGQSGGWVQFDRPMPSEAIGREIVLQFRFLSTTGEGYGWAIDSLTVER